MEKRVVIFLILSIAVILSYDWLLKEFGWLPPSASVQEEPVDNAPTRQSAEPGPLSAPVRGNPEVDVAVAKADPVPATADGKLTVETDVLRVVLGARGGTISSWQLKHYRSAPTEEKWVELVHQNGKFRGPLAVVLADATADKAVREGVFSLDSDFVKLDASHPEGHVTLRFHDAATGLMVQKQLTFHFGGYEVDVVVTVQGATEPYEVVLGTNFGIVEWGDGMIGSIGPASLVDGKVEKETPDAQLERKGSVQWVALQDKYFIGVLMPQRGTTALARKESDKVVSASVKTAAIGDGTANRLRLYAGPKEYDTLRSLNVGLEDTIDFGWFIFGSWSVVKAVAKPIFYVLRFINEYTHNYGVTIILLTMGIKLLFVPLQYKSYKSMKQMQVIQPKVLAVQEKFKDDRDRLNKELIKLYRDHKVNPVGGCLPMVLQMPVFVALFNILYMTIDLRQAPFFGWITDLSVQDPYYVLPIIMGATMVLQQKITPTTMDPTQAKIMLMLPAFMTFLFINFPAGLVLYWLTNNVLTITQQIVTDRLFFAKPLVVEPAK
ncbi:Membrane protein insertase YidC [Nitrospira japonica]|uniref:Membrane protein insertase YidC n=1 Tax=Nitrospira japonica TaxID=1325564 RepID=A0A1W1I3K4_9BACT|nr:membrane protein insertase YidC [Nitrospira japonica]SLM47580.1 Membrane protein insertase YidC [Nitrospira japonica]